MCEVGRMMKIPKAMHPEIEITFEKARECMSGSSQKYNITKYKSYREMVRAEKAEFNLRTKISDQLY